MQLNVTYNEDCLEGMSKRLLDKSIDLTVTSPPYDDLRTYKGYEFEFRPIAQELYRVIKLGGVLVWVVGDATINGTETGTSFRQALYFKDIGFNLHDTMIYEKGGFSNPSSNRYHQVFEYMFVLTKGKPKTFNPLKDRQNYYDRRGGGKRRKRNGGFYNGKGGQKLKNYGMRFNIWHYSIGGGISTRDKIAYGHPAIFPEKLAEDHILSWSNKNDIVLDPLYGSGTTLKMAKKNNRHYIGFEINPEYCEIARKRLSQVQLELTGVDAS